jgi:hypothetical protein
MQAMLHHCKEAEFVITAQPNVASMLGKVHTIVDSASTIFMFIRSQMPYPYVQLVSFTVKFYLFFWATYMGTLLHAGIPDGSVVQSAITGPLQPGTSADDAWVCPAGLMRCRSSVYSAREQPWCWSGSCSSFAHVQVVLSGDDTEVNTSVKQAHRADGWFNLLWAYGTIAFCNAVFQGLLNIHMLLDNPYGDHCCKFPLRAQIVELLNTSRTMLSFAEQLPTVVAGLFPMSPRADSTEIAAQSGVSPSAMVRALPTLCNS